MKRKGKKNDTNERSNRKTKKKNKKKKKDGNILPNNTTIRVYKAFKIIYTERFKNIETYKIPLKQAMKRYIYETVGVCNIGVHVDLYTNFGFEIVSSLTLYMAFVAKILSEHRIQTFILSLRFSDITTSYYIVHIGNVHVQPFGFRVLRSHLVKDYQKRVKKKCNNNKSFEMKMQRDPNGEKTK